jgi:hypothetical protein
MTHELEQREIARIFAERAVEGCCSGGAVLKLPLGDRSGLVAHFHVTEVGCGDMEMSTREFAGCIEQLIRDAFEEYAARMGTEGTGLTPNP